MKRIHEKLYNVPDFVKLFILYFLLFYFVDAILPQAKDMPDLIFNSIFYGIGAGILYSIYMKPRYKKKSGPNSNDI